MVVLGTRFLHARPPVGLAVIGRLECSRSIEPADEEEIVTEGDDTKRVQPRYLRRQ